LYRIKDKEEESSEQVTEDDDRDQQGSAVLYIQMQFCEKETLRKAIDSGDLARNRFRMWNLFRQIVEGISYFHSKGVVHRDLNVLIQYNVAFFHIYLINLKWIPFYE